MLHPAINDESDDEAANRQTASLGGLAITLLLLMATVSTSHAVARMDHRLLLALATALHHLGTAAWIGAMPFLLISLARADSVAEAQTMAGRYSQMALLSVAGACFASTASKPSCQLSAKRARSCTGPITDVPNLAKIVGTEGISILDSMA